MEAAQQFLDKLNSKRRLADTINLTLQDVYDIWKNRDYPKLTDKGRETYDLAWAKFSCVKDLKMRDINTATIQELVDARHWLTLQELSDVAAISQATPGPIGVNLATFLGFRQGGMLGALLCTVGLLLPSYLLMLAALSSLERWHQSLVVRGIIDGLAPVVVGLMAATMVIYLELSVFTEPIPWRYFGGKILGFAGDYPEGFRVCLGSLPIFIASVWLLYKGKCSIMTAIFSSAAFGAFFCR